MVKHKPFLTRFAQSEADKRWTMAIDIAEEKFFFSKGIRLHSIDWGGEGKTLVLLAGLGDNVQIFSGLASKLSNDFRVVGLTRRGHGRSERPESGYDRILWWVISTVSWIPLRSTVR